MESIAFAIPILPGMSDDCRLIASECLGKRKKDYAESLGRIGIYREFNWIQKSSAGDILIMYIETDDLQDAMENWINAKTPFDKWQKQQLHYVTGIDFSNPDELPPTPEVLFEIQGEALAHAVPIARVVPILEGKNEQLTVWFEKLKGPRCDELKNYLERAGFAREAWYRQHTPGGNLLITYTLAEDPVESFRGFAYSDNPFDQWMKEKLMEFTGIDYNAPPEGPLPEDIMPELILDWHHAFQAAQT